MDIMKVQSDFMTGILSKLINKIIKKKLDREITVDLNDISVKVEDKIRIHVNIDAELTKDEFKKLMEQFKD